MTRTLKLKIKLEDDAFTPFELGCRQEVVSILEGLADDFKRSKEFVYVDCRGPLLDSNGKKVGCWNVG